SRMAAGEDEIEALVPGRPRDRWTARHRPLLEERELFAIACVATEAIDGFASRRRREPRPRIVGNAVARPAFECGHERVLYRILRDVEVAEEADHRRGDASHLVAHDAGELVVRRGEARLDGVTARGRPTVGLRQARRAASRPTLSPRRSRRRDPPRSRWRIPRSLPS